MHRAGWRGHRWRGDYSALPPGYHAGAHVRAYGGGASDRDGSQRYRSTCAGVDRGGCGGLHHLVLLQRRTKLVSIKAQIRGETPQERRPGFLRQTLHSLTQIVAVGAGAPVGKEVAPRELGALFAGRLADLMRIPQTVRPVLVASAAAAGLAAVYQVPVGGFVFLFEALSLALSLRNIFTGAILIFVATCTAHLVIPDAPTYPVPQLQTTGESLLLAVVLGLAITPLALWFRAASHAQRASRPRIGTCSGDFPWYLYWWR